MTTSHRSTPRGRPSTISRTDLIACARSLGPDRLSFRDVAAALDVPRTTVYNHARGPHELGQAVLSTLLDASYAGALDHWAREDPWTDQLAAFAVKVRAAQLSAGPWLRFYDADVHLTRDVLSLVDHLIGVLVAAGFTLDEAGHALGFVNAVIEHSVRAHGRASETPAEHHRSAVAAEQFPWFAAAQTTAPPDWEEQRFRYELRCAIDGIAANRSRPRAREGGTCREH